MTKWNLDKEHLINQKNEVLDNLDKAQNRKDQLLRENERLKTENKRTKRILSNGHGHLGGGMFERGTYGGTYLNTSKYAERSFRKDDMRIQTESGKGDKENDFTTGGKFNVLDSESKRSKSPLHEMVNVNIPVGNLQSEPPVLSEITEINKGMMLEPVMENMEN